MAKANANAAYNNVIGIRLFYTNFVLLKMPVGQFTIEEKLSL